MSTTKTKIRKSPAERCIGDLELKVMTSKGLDELKNCIREIAIAVDTLTSNLGDGSMDQIEATISEKIHNDNKKSNADLRNEVEKLRKRIDNI